MKRKANIVSEFDFDRKIFGSIIFDKERNKYVLVKDYNRIEETLFSYLSSNYSYKADINEEGRFIFSNTEKGYMFSVDYENPVIIDINYNSYKLGIPVRNIYCYEFDRKQIDTYKCVYTEDFELFLKKDYPKIEDLKMLFDAGFERVAVSRKLFIDKDFNLHYSSKGIIGKILEDKILVEERFPFIKALENKLQFPCVYKE